MNKKIKIGWVGSGFIGQVAHLSSFTTLDNIKITGLAELRENLRHDIQKKYQILNVFKNHKELLDYGDFDAVIAIVRRHHTATIAKDILNAGYNLFTEKPQASTYSSAKKLVSIAKKNKLTYACGLMRRHDEGIKFAKKKISEFLKNKKLGKIIGADFFCFAGGDYCNIGNYIKTSEPRPLMNLSDKYPSW